MKFNNIHLSLLALVACFVTGLFTACAESHENTIDHWKWDKGTSAPDGETAGKPRYMWIDAPANFSRFANSRENIREDLKKARDCGITHVVVDVRPYTGDVLFNSTTAQPATQLDYWEGSQYKYFQRTATWDYLQAFIDEGHKLGLKVLAGMNTFVGGCMNNYGLGGQGMLFRDPSKKSWATVYNRS
ncbi:MAG: S-layer protein, partial [Prevotellaceae bacterium]|nr:S-layer protein [Prevotellaceae bacterium]